MESPTARRAAIMRSIETDVRPPYSVQFELSYRCNLRCNMCYNGSGPARPGELTDSEWLDIVQQTIDVGILEAIVSGGEPLVRGPEFVCRIVEMLSDAGISVHLITNGGYVDRDFVRSLSGLNIRIIQTSIDGHIPEIHDVIRGPNFNDVVTATTLFTTHGFFCRIGTTIQRLNEHHLEDLVNLAILLGAQEIVIDQFLPIGRSIGNYQEIATTRSHEDIRDEVQKLSETYSNLIVVRQGMFCRDQLHHQGEQEFSDSVIVRPNGDLRIGCMAPFSCGNVRDGGFAEVWQRQGALAWHSPKVRKYVESVTDNPSLMAAHKRLGANNGYENESL